MIAVYEKEMRGYFTHVTGYAFATFLLLIIGIWFVISNVRAHNPNFHFVLSNASIFFFILVPLLTMRLFSEESKQKTDQLLLSSPLSVFQIVLGKFLAAASLFIITTVASVVLPIILGNHGDLPVSVILGTYIGFILLGISCIAVGVFISVLTDSQIVAGFITVGVIFFMYIMDAFVTVLPITPFASLMFVLFVVLAVSGVWYNAMRNWLAAVIVGTTALAIAGGLYLVNNLIYDGIMVRVLLWFSIFARFDNFILGILSLNDVVYYLSFSALFVYLTINVIEKRRWR